MKNIISFFKGIAHFFDRYVIMPITRLVYKITKNIGIPNKKFETWLSKSSTLLFISLFIAIFVFIAVDQKIINLSNQSAEVLRNQKVSVTYNEEQYVVEGLPDKVDVTLIGSKADLYIAKQSSAGSVNIDLTGLKPGTHKVNIKYDLGKSKIDYSVNPSVATIIIYDKKSDIRTLSYDVVNEDKLNNTLVVNSVNLETDEVTIRGAEYKIKQVASVKALINVDNITNKSVGKQTMNDIDLKAYDADGNIVDVEFVPAKVSAELELASPSKKVPLKFVPVGEMPKGKSIGGYTFSQNNVTIYGDSETLDSIDDAEVVVDVSKITSDTTVNADIKKPSGVKSLSSNTVKVTLIVTEASSEPIRFTVPLTGINVGPGLIAQPIDEENGKITVEVQGASSVISSIDKSDITVYVDLEGLEPGTYEKEIMVKGSNPLATYKALRTKATVIITEKP